MVSDNRYFSEDYFEARRNFLSAVQAASGRLESFSHPSFGPNGEELATDVAEFGPTQANNALFVCSATHGIEGFAGSAVQIGLIHEGWQKRLPEETKLVLIHAINPYGFAFLRRFDENNVDLNRNFFEPDQERPENRGYDTLAKWIAPKSISPISEFNAFLRLLLFAAGHGTSATRKAVTGGQYRHPDGLFYGGESKSWSATTLETVIKNYSEGVSRAIFFDIHTGLGPNCAAEMISNSPKDSAQYIRAHAIWGDMLKTTKADESVSADLTGTLKMAVIKTLPNVEVTAASIEFGTVPVLVALRALRAENWLHHAGDVRDPRAKRIKRNLLAAFNPDSDRWRENVWKEGCAAVEKSINWLAAKSKGTEP